MKTSLDASESVAGKLTELRLRWQEHRDRGDAVTPEALCADCPELLDELRRQLAALEAMEAALGVGPRTASAPRPPDTPPGMPAPPPGYEILGVLDQGGMGVVYKARQRATNRVVGLKVPLAGPCAQPDQLARFRTEIEAAARLRHPNVVQIYEVGEWAGQPYFSMEYVEGGSLARQLAEAVLPARQAAELVETLATTIHAAHQQGILHRDLKPANVLIQRELTAEDAEERRENAGGLPLRLSAPSAVKSFVPKLTDFGLAKRLGEDGPTQAGAILGTPSYLAPEQAGGKSAEIGPAVDVYALGAILYECLTGRPPFRGESTLDTLEQVRRREPIPPSQLQPKVPRDLETICLKCLQKEPRKRYLSAADLAADLHRFLAGEPIRARRTPLWEQGVKWVRRQPALAALLVVTVAAAAALLTGWALFTARLHDERDRAERERAEAVLQQRRAEESQRQAEEQRLAAQRERDTARAQRQRAETLVLRCVAAIGEHAQATERAKFMVCPQGEPGALLVELARFYTGMSATYRSLPELKADDRAKFAEQYATQAVHFLKRAHEAHFFDDPGRRASLRQDPDFALLRPRADFTRLLNDLTGRVRRGG
jgi:serine/threonine protein kinase/Tfp pilus assembly protein PilN